MTENAFDTTWLNTRFAFDETARNPQVDQSCLDYLNDSENNKRLHLLDIGSGTGANFLHFFEKIKADQNWYFLDHDPRLLQASLKRIIAYTNAGGYTISEKEKGLEIKCSGKNISIQLLNASFENLESLLPISNLDLVMASAFFDLFTPDQLHRFFHTISKASCSLLLTLNYSGMQFSPKNPLDDSIVKYYEKHMQRPQAAGTAMGPYCSTLIRDYLQAEKKPFIEGTSIWKIEGKDQKMLRFLLGFMEEAIGELSLSEVKKQEVKRWFTLRKKQLADHQLNLRVAHFDFFCRG